MPEDAITDAEKLWRRIVPDWFKQSKLTSAAFIDRRSGEVSINRAAMTTVEAVMAPYPTQGLVEFEANKARTVGFKLKVDPQPEDASHAVVLSDHMTNGERKKAARKLTKECSWIRAVPGAAA